MKEKSVLNILQHLFKHHLHQGHPQDYDVTDLMKALQEHGFNKKSIMCAFEWLQQLDQPMHDDMKIPCAQSLRVYNQKECAIFDVSCRGLLTYLVQQEILTASTRELVISQVYRLKNEGIDLNLIKWVALTVLFCQPENTQALAYMEFLVLDDTMSAVH